MFWKVAITTAALASTACAEIRPLAVDQKIEVRAVDVLERSYEDVANRYLEKRASHDVNAEWVPPSEVEVKVNADGSINMTAWEQETSKACSDALSHLDAASNPSGTCICYNLPSLDPKTGVFEADLRLFKVSEPNGAFSGIPPQNIQVGLSFNGASVSPVSANRIAGGATRRDLAKEMTFEVAWAGLQKRAVQPQALQSYLFVGQIDQSRMVAPMSMSQLEALVMPTLTLTGVNAAGQSVSTNVSSNEASFITGVFSKEVIRSDLSMAQAAVDDVVAGLKNGTVAFVLPGVQLMVFPIGLIITSTWLVIGLAFYGFGTYERIGYAESYRRRRAVAGDTAKRI
ncbi:hypothetical protein CMUS01_13991 [Colletotrichum musicola]|uniref:Uncharacterized protein n=1 Tax=Colletotrichum musicola TaxID=2175873 RepID=A0A8H6J7N0_9PEZI|nr:hypothetical protein CMUS01_13991 [Colletotrichum musicola]